MHESRAATPETTCTILGEGLRRLNNTPHASQRCANWGVTLLLTSGCPGAWHRARDLYRWGRSHWHAGRALHAVCPVWHGAALAGSQPERRMLVRIGRGTPFFFWLVVGRFERENALHQRVPFAPIQRLPRQHHVPAAEAVPFAPAQHGHASPKVFGNGDSSPNGFENSVSDARRFRASRGSLSRPLRMCDSRGRPRALVWWCPRFDFGITNPSVRTTQTQPLQLSTFAQI